MPVLPPLPEFTDETFEVSREPWPLHRRLLLAAFVLASVTLLALSWPRVAPSFSLSEVQRRAQSTLSRFTAYRGPVRVGLQVGHLNAQDHPEELARLRYSTGAHVNGLREVDLNLAVAQHLQEALELEGVTVDVLPATVPRAYQADLVLSLHADASPDPARRGYKSAHLARQRNALEPLLKTHIDEAYFFYTGLPDDDANVTGNMLWYYAFNRRHAHSVAQSTPALLVELGYISNAADRAFLADPVNPAYALKQGVMSYLKTQGRLPEASAEATSDE